MRKKLLFSFVLLLAIYSTILAQDTSNRVIRMREEMLRLRPQIPIITIIADRNPVQITEQVKFTLQPEDITTNSPFTYTINFGDESQAVKENEKSYFFHEYLSAGSFKVSVSIDIPPGAEIFEAKPVMANTLAIQVENISLFVEPLDVEVNQNVFFEVRYNSTSKNIRYNFNFGDNSTSGWVTEKQITHIYTKPGTYSSFTEISGLKGGSLYPIATSITKQINVKIPFSVELTVDNFNPKVGDLVTFTASSNRLEEALEYWFNFGDDDQTIRNIQSVISKMYKEPGDYRVSVQLALNGNPLKVFSIIPIKVLPITVELIAGNTNAFVGDIITFSALTNSTNRDIKYFFNFGDNSEVTVSNISSINHAYAGPGNFKAFVKLAINNEPITKPATLDIKISPQIIVTLQADKPNAIEGEQVKFKAITSSVDNGFNYEFNFGDNTPSQTINNSTISHSFLHKGNYKASVKLSKNGRVLSKSDFSINISTRQFIVNLKVDKPDSHPGDTLTFIASSNYHDAGLDYLFDFGDDTPVQLTEDSIVRHVYNNQRNFTASVQLLLNNIQQAQDTFEVKINLLPPPTVSLSVEPDSGDTGNRFIFTAIASNQRSGLEYWFYTGDKDQPIRTLKDTIHYVYLDSGKYTAYVRLFVNEQEIAISPNVEIKVTPNEFPWWLYSVVALIILGGGFLGRKYAKRKPKKGNNIPDVRPTFHPYPDKGSSNIKEPKKFRINYEIHFNPNLANAINLLKPKEENLIKLKTVKP